MSQQRSSDSTRGRSMWDALMDAKAGVTPVRTDNEWGALGAALSKAYADAAAQSTTLSSSTSSGTGSDMTMSIDETHGLSLAEISKRGTEQYWKEIEQSAREQLSRMERPPSYAPSGIASRNNLRQLIRAGRKVIKAVMFKDADKEARTLAAIAANAVPDQVRV